MTTASRAALTPKAWLLAARPRTLTASIVPILVGTVLAIPYVEGVSWFLAACAFISAICIQIATNIINDAIDYKNGVDTIARIGTLRPTQQALLSGHVTPAYVLGGGFCFLLVAFSAAIPLMLKGGIPIIAVILASMLCAYLYTGGPYPFTMTGIGDFFVLVFFGLVATIAPFYVQAGFVSVASLIAGIQIGLLATAIIAVNNTRDADSDAKAGRKTIPIRYGILAGKIEITICVLTPFALNMFWWIANMPAAAILPLLALPMGWLVLHNIWRTSPGKQYNKFLLFTALLHLNFGCLLALGIWMS